MLAKEKIHMLFMFSHDRGSYLLFCDNLTQDSSPLDLEMLVSGRWGERYIIKLCKYSLMVVQ